MLHKKRLDFSLGALLMVIAISAIIMSGSKAFAQDALPSEKTPEKTFLPLIHQQSDNNGGKTEASTPAEGDHSEDDYVLAERARKRNEPRFEVSEDQTRATGPLNQVGEWGPVRTWPFAFASAANLPDGRIAVWGANNLRSFNGGNFTYSSIWDPETDQLLSRNHNDHSMFCAIPTILEDGRVFANGGDGNSPKTSIFDYRTNQWNRTDNQNTGRWYPGSLVLPGDKVFTMLGRPGGPYPEVWEEGAGWSLLTGANLNNGVLNFSGYQSTWLPYLHLMPDGNVFHSGPTAQMNIINPAGNGSISSAGLSNTWYPKYGSAVMYDEGKILFAGGGTNNESTNQAMILDFNGPNPTKTATTPMNNPRKFNNGVMLPTGEVIMLGGNTSGTEFSDSGSILEAEIWNPDTQVWRSVANASVPRNYHAVALLMPDGRVWSGGGGLCNCAADHPNHQVYSPPYLFNADGSLADRPTINSAPDSAGYGATINVQASNDIQRFTMVKMSGVTHNLNSDQRFLNVDFTSPSNGSYSLTLNSNLNVLTPGYWMLFALDDQGVPSVSHALQIQHDSTAVDVTNPGSQDTHEGTPVNLTLDVSNPSGNSLTFSAIGLPTGLNLNSATGTISGTPTAVGQFNVSVSVTDGATSDTANFGWIIIEAGNVSYGKPATQSSTYVTGTADNAVDGDTNGVYSSGSVTHTQSDANAWWQVDLGESVDISQINVYNRTDCCSNRTSNVYVFVSDTDLTGRSYTDILNDSSVWRNFTSGQIPNQLEITEATTGRYVRVQLAGTNFLSLAEVEVFAEPQANQDPILTNPGNISSPAGILASQSFAGTDPDGDTLTYSATGIPTGLVFTASTGGALGISNVAGDYNVTITANDGNGGTASMSFVWTIYEGLAINPINTRPKEMNSTLGYLAGTAGGSNPQFKWLFGDGTPETEYSSSSLISHTFTEPGRYIVTLTATDDSGQEIVHQFSQLIHRPLTTEKPAVSMSIVYEEHAGNDRVWNVNPDNNTVTVINTINQQKLAEISVGENPRALAVAPDGRVWVTNKNDATISIINADTFNIVQTVNLSPGSQPHGIIFAPNGDDAYVALEAVGRLVKLNPATGAQRGTVNVGPNPRHLSMLADSSRVYISRFITPLVPGEETGNPQFNLGGGEVVVVNTDMSVLETITLQHSDRPDTEGDGRGIPNYLGPAVISPDGLAAWVPSKQDNIARGTLRDGENLDFDHSVRSITSYINLANNQEQFVNRVDHDNGGIASSAVFDPYGAYLFVALEGSREVAVIDAYARTELFRIDVGIAPQGLTLSSPFGSTLFVHNFIDRTISVLDIKSLFEENLANNLQLLSTVDSVANERLSAEVLTGKALFYDAKDTRLALDGYMSCASCHNAGDSDGRVWDFTGMGEGLRNTISLQGHANQGPLHWTANFDEVHDFEGQIRSFAQGTGLMSNSDFNATQDPLGAPKAGLSTDLDAMAAYVNSLTTVTDSPYRQANGSLTTEGEAGKQVFVAQGCATCHSGDEFTDSAPGVMHNVGTLKSSSGQRLNGPLNALDTPTLRGLWMTAPYLHDGSAPTLGEAVNAHTGINLTGSDITNLIAYLNQIDEREPAPAVPNLNSDPSITDPGSQSSMVGDTISLQINATDPDGDSLTFSSATLPAGLNISNSGLIAGSPTTAGVSNVAINVDDGNGGTDSLSFSWTVSEDTGPPPTGTGQITWEYWNTTWGSDLATLRNDPNFPDAPANSGVLTSFEAPSNRADLFGQRISGYLYPPVTGDYTFWIASDDQGELWLSTDDQAANISEIASVPSWTGSQEWTRHPEQQSVTISLQAGQAYYVEALAQEGGGGDNLAVAWQVPGGNRVVIDGQYLSPVDGGTNPPTNNAPVLASPGNQSTEVGDAVSLQLAATDADNDPLTFSTPGLPAGLNLNASSGLISGSPSTAGLLNVNISVSDGNGGTDSISFLWTVTDSTPPPPGNIDPVLSSIANQTNEVGDTVSVQLSASDADNDTLTYSVTGLPAGLNINSSTGLISGSPTTAVATNVTVSVSDGNGGSDSTSFVWTVSEPPPPPPGGGTGLILWETWNTGWGTNLSVLRSDPDFPNNPDTSDTLTSLQAPINRADVFGQRMSGYIYPPVTGSYTFWISSDDQGEFWLSTDESPSNLSMVANVPGWTFSEEWTKYPEQQSIAVTLQAGQAYYIEALAQEGAQGDHLAIAWQIPGSSLEIVAGEYLSPADGGSNPPPPPTNSAPVLNNPGTQSHEVGDTVNLALVATDADNDPLTFSVNQLPAGLSLNSGTGQISGSPTTAGTINLNVTVNDGQGGSDSVSFIWTITEAAPPPPPPPGGGTGEIRLETWNTGWGTILSVLRGTTTFPDNPDSTQTITSFEAPENRGDVFGQRISGYLYPPVTGEYTFWIASDDQGELWLSTTNSPAAIELIAMVPQWTNPREWDKTASQQSVTITLQAGQAYYIEALAQEGAQGDHLAVAWQIPGQARGVIDGQYLAPID
ncbi:MAG: putative Ig domain-containing protein [Anaerolineae bacterium]